jgi:dihydrofolate synthase / folylpolyglutamate synthase
MSYPDSVRFLYALGNELKVGAKFGLERMRALLGGLHNPQDGLKFVHVAGTNGKGSTCAMIASSCQASGLLTGLFTSPHLIAPTERIKIDGQAVTEDRFAELFQTVHRKAEEMVEKGTLDAHPSYFETVTAMALEAFRGTTDIVVLEVGLGGRLDATNIVSPQLTVITPVDYDHEAFLGNTLSSIASEKAGILKPGVPLISGQQHPEAEAIILGRALELGCKVRRSSDAAAADLKSSPYGSQFRFLNREFTCPLAGRHQIDNALTAILASLELGIPINAVQRGIASTRWPGRLELVRRRPDWVLDGAHNPAGARALASYIQEFCADREVWLVYGAMRDKAIDEVTAQLFPLASKLILTAPDFPRALRPEAILEVSDHPNAVIASTIPEAMALARTAPEGAIVFFTGSLFVVGEVRRIMEAEKNRPSTIEL